MRVLVSGSSRVVEQITPILNSIGNEVDTHEGLSDIGKKMIESDLILVDANSEGLETICYHSAGSKPVCILVTSNDTDWPGLSQQDICGYIHLHLGDSLLKAFLEAIIRRIKPALR